MLNENSFSEFDSHLCSLLGTPMLNASLEVKNRDLAVLALGMGAAVSVVQLAELENKLGVNLADEFDSCDGRCALLIIVAKAGHRDTLRYLLERGSKLEAKNEWGCTALHFAAGTGHLEVVSLLVEFGAKLDVKTSDGCTALHNAANNGHLEVVLLLLERGAELEAKDYKNRTAVH